MNRVAVEKKVLSENQILADQLRDRYRQHGILWVNLVSAPGSGKTTLLERTRERMDKRARVAVLTGDQQTDNDAARLAKFGFPVKQIVTGGTCHLASNFDREASHRLAPARPGPADRGEYRQPGVPIKL